MSIAKKLWLLIIGISIAIGLLTSALLFSERTLLMEERQAGVRQAVEVGHGIVAHFQGLAAKGEMTDDQAKRAALSAVKGLRYSDSEYLFISDMQPRMVMHPIKPELDGTDLTSTVDTDGKHMFVEMVAAVKAAGAGYVGYNWPKPGSSSPVPKISYVKGFAPWGWVIGSGVYVEAVDAVFVKRAVTSAGVVAIFTVMLLVFCSLTARSITRPIQRAVTIAKTIGKGDLTSHIKVEGAEEIRKLMQGLHEMNASLRHIVAQVRVGASTIAAGSDQIASGNLDLSSRTEQQASSLEETASSMEQLTSTVKQNADNAHQADQLAKQASDVARKGGLVVSQVVGTMTEINDSSRKIVDIISVIDSIAFQTNILALNAAVEAARAGEQGRGFAVVATEVRSLAQRSAAAAKEIKTLIGDSVEKVETGARLVDEAGTTMNEIVDSIKRVTDIMGEITVASQEQTAGIEQINQAISEMDNVTQQNAALVEEAAAAAEGLQDQAASLSEVVAVFKTGDAETPASIAAESIQQAARPLAGVTRKPMPMRTLATAHTTADGDWDAF